MGDEYLTGVGLGVVLLGVRRFLPYSPPDPFQLLSTGLFALLPLLGTNFTFMFRVDLPFFLSDFAPDAVHPPVGFTDLSVQVVNLLLRGTDSLLVFRGCAPQVSGLLCFQQLVLRFPFLTGEATDPLFSCLQVALRLRHWFLGGVQLGLVHRTDGEPLRGLLSYQPRSLPLHRSHQPP